jgi:hypothetical protein
VNVECRSKVVTLYGTIDDRIVRCGSDCGESRRDTETKVKIGRKCVDGGREIVENLC